MNIYNLDKGENLDTDGRLLNDYIHTALINASNIIISDGENSKATIKDMSNIFADLNYVRTIDLSKLNTANVTNLSNCFLGSVQSLFFCTSNLINITNFNTTNVTNMTRSFFRLC